MKAKLFLLSLLVGVSAEMSVSVGPSDINITNRTTQKQGVVGVRLSSTSQVSGLGMNLINSSVKSPTANIQELVATTVWDKAMFDPSPAQSSRISFNWGSNLSNKTELLYKKGECSMPPRMNSSLALSLTDLSPLLESPSYYQSVAPYVDLLGSNGGAYAGGIMDSYLGQTQDLVALPTSPITVGGTQAQFTTQFLKSPLTLMSLAMIQEFFGLDQQLLTAVFAKETAFMLARNNGTINWHKELWSNRDGAFGPGEVEATSYLTRALAYPKFFPFDTCLQSPNARDAVVAASICGFTENQFASKYMGSDHTDPDSSQIVNAILASAFIHFFNYDLLSSVNKLGFKQALTMSTDSRIGLCADLPLYNLGINSGAEAPLAGKPTTDWTAFSCSNFPVGNGNYRVDIVNVATSLENASQKASRFEDPWISIDDIRRFYFGDNSPLVNPYTIEGNQQNGGLLKHFKLSLSERESLWQDLSAAFELMAAHWPTQSSQKVISLRYDWLSHLRIAKKYLDLDRGLPVSEEAQQWIMSRSSGVNTDVMGRNLDTHWPFAQIQSTGLNSANQYEVSIGAQELNVNDRGVAKIEWTHKRDWTLFNQTGVQLKSQAGLNSTWQIQIPRNLVQKDSTLYFRVTDSCGNAIVVEHLAIDPALPVQLSLPNTVHSIWRVIQSSDLSQLDQTLMGQKLHLEIRNLKGQLMWEFHKQAAGKITWPSLGADPVYFKLSSF